MHRCLAGMSCVLCILTFVGAAFAEKPVPERLLDLPLVFQDGFDKEPTAWQPASPEAWKIIEQDKNRVYSQFKHVPRETPVRSPFNRSLVKDLVVSDCVLDVRVQSTVKDYGHRDVCLFFGYQDPSHMYYVHLGKQADDHANQIFIVNEAPRLKISTKSTSGTNWDDNWHHVRVVRKVETGQIDVYFDNMDEPVMQAVDKTFAWGQVGVGTFDDTANFDDVAIYGTKTKRPGQ